MGHPTDLWSGLSESPFIRATLRYIPGALCVLIVLTFVVSEKTLIGCGPSENCRPMNGHVITSLLTGKALNSDGELAVPPSSSPAGSNAYATTGGPAVSDPIPPRRSELLRIERRLGWIFFVGAGFFVGALAFAVTSGVSAATATTRDGSVRRAITTSAPVFFAFLLLWRWPDQHMTVMKPLIENTIVIENPFAFPAALPVMVLGNALSTALSLGFIIAIWYLLEPIRSRKAGEDADDYCLAAMRSLAAKASYLRLILYVGTINLVIGVFRMNATILLAQAYLANSDGDMVDALRTTMVSVVGGSYTLLLAALYLPAVLIIRHYAREIMADSSKVAAEEAKPYAAVLDVPFAAMLPKALAIASPLLAGPIGEMLRLASG